MGETSKTELNSEKRRETTVHREKRPRLRLCACAQQGAKEGEKGRNVEKHGETRRNEEKQGETRETGRNEEKRVETWEKRGKTKQLKANALFHTLIMKI